MTEENRPTNPEDAIEFIKNLMLKRQEGEQAQETIQPNLVKNLMPQKDYHAVKRFIDKFGQVLNSPYERQQCGCMYIVDETKAGFQTWVYISRCPICNISEGFHNHRFLYTIHGG